MMNKRIKRTFDQIHADTQTKTQTKEYVMQQIQHHSKHGSSTKRALIPAIACLFLLFFGGRWLFFTPTATISMDINPSIELNVNRFNQVIGVQSYNDDGEKLLESLDVLYMDYEQAVNTIMNNEMIASLLEQDEIMSIAVLGSNDTQTETILKQIRSCTNSQHTYCYRGDAEEMQDAHACGLSYGKYKAYLDLKEVDPSIQIDDVKNMTMREIREQIIAASHSDSDALSSVPGMNGNGIGKKDGNGYQKGKNS